MGGEMTEEFLDDLEARLSGLNDRQKLWLGGYLSGRASKASANGSPVAEKTRVTNGTGTVQILYGTRSGNSARVAEKMAAYCRAAGLSVAVENMKETGPESLSQMSFAMIVVSTHGEGDPPGNVEWFYDRLHGTGMEQLPRLHYSVLALGDSSYRNFCQTGKDIDQRLAGLGAERLGEVTLCDLDFEFTAAEWMDRMCGILVKRILGGEAAKIKSEQPAGQLFAGDKSIGYTGRIVKRRKLTGKSSSKDVFHMVLDTGSQHLSHKPGDCIRVRGRNSRNFVDRIIRTLGYNPATTIGTNGDRVLLKESLIHNYELTRLTPLVITKYAEMADLAELNLLVSDEGALHDYATERDIFDLLSDFRQSLEPEQFVSMLRKLHPRQYSIASGSLSHPGEIHLTVSWMHYPKNGRNHEGVATTYLREFLELGESVDFEFEENDAFRFPEDQGIPLIMVATSTGIAPFRAVLQDRQHAGIEGNTWLFFGDRNESSDFLYGEEMREFRKKGILERMDVAFSRDGEQKQYVQDRIRSSEKNLVDWLERGARVYLCGTRNNMASEVRSAIRDALVHVHRWTEAKAETCLREMKEDGRYCEDIY